MKAEPHNTTTVVITFTICCRAGPREDFLIRRQSYLAQFWFYNKIFTFWVALSFFVTFLFLFAWKQIFCSGCACVNINIQLLESPTRLTLTNKKTRVIIEIFYICAVYSVLGQWSLLIISVFYKHRKTSNIFVHTIANFQYFNIDLTISYS